MTASLPVWSIPFLLILVAISGFVGHLPPAALGVAVAETVLVCLVLLRRARQEPAGPRPVSNLVALVPGHLLVLLIVALLESPGFLAWLWTILPAATLLYDSIGRSPRFRLRTRMSISIILYVILWADLFFLLERGVVLHRQLGGNQGIMIAAGIGLVGVLFLSLGVYRHWIAAKE
jgi:hypothetical protein